MGSTVTFAQYVRVLRRQWYIVIAAALLVLMASAAWSLHQKPMYSSTTRLFVSVRTPDTDISTLSQGSSFIQERVKSYADIATSPDVLDEVIRKLQLGTTSDRLADDVKVESPPDTVLLNMTVTGSDPRTAASVANEIAMEFPAFPYPHASSSTSPSGC
jgi:polysaccharide biosynthesis transport protein